MFTSIFLTNEKRTEKVQNFVYLVVLKFMKGKKIIKGKDIKSKHHHLRQHANRFVFKRNYKNAKYLRQNSSKFFQKLSYNFLMFNFQNLRP